MLLGYIHHINAKKSLKQTVYDHFEIVIGFFCKFIAIFTIFRRFRLLFLSIKRFFERVGGTTFLGERVLGPFLNSDLQPTILLCAIPTSTYKPAARGADNFFLVQIPHVKFCKTILPPRGRYTQKMNHKKVLLYKPKT
jgi:hypothetical protein